MRRVRAFERELFVFI